ncbi:flagellar basal body rod C-terminal domain-containing protein [Rhodoplanes sp. TEM]|uniref:Flagellar basal body rod C-terminal domain-containing protein n=1 Tax=Rhodoplanes tepidamans TaxID=200616 RepID=A0ABT5JJM4_RHOTP|nr:MULTISPECIES: flagellar basal body rod C-terminal domain-containing protein [Rhodoplanes]MDC7789779.1 flagellar basal body rod C-terminal domain-containing protein [Rhodoplanes tepidamans]MDC7984889.1 flagellar basal body rod C-terminal domain-containing protein [Rhodoplanes sp. TEM]MDQ0357017.1 flagellar basal-body rod protein FlgC [Rhodoplanes tepidamans]
MSSISTIAVSGMTAAVRRVEVSAGNVANVRSTGALPAADGRVPEGLQQAYTPLRVTQTAVAGGGTRATVTAATPAHVPTSDPQAPFADPNGLVAAPIVDLSQEMVEQVIASYTFTADARLVQADDEMTQTLLDATA